MQGKRMLVKILAMAMVALLGLGAAGCAKKSSSTSSTGKTQTTQQGQTQQSGNRPGSMDPQKMQENIKKALSGLVSKGTITQQQADKVAQALADRGNPSNNPGGASNNQANSNQGNSDQGGGNRGARVNPLTRLMDDGTLTTAQADAIREAIQKAMPQPPNGAGRPAPGQNSNNQ